MAEEGIAAVTTIVVTKIMAPIVLMGIIITTLTITLPALMKIIELVAMILLQEVITIVIIIIPMTILLALMIIPLVPIKAQEMEIIVENSKDQERIFNQL
jgi:hypothetical protein